MHRMIDETWTALAAPRIDPAARIVRFDFSGIFTSGSHEGTPFAGRIEYDARQGPSERHASFAIYDEWPAPIVTVAVGGQILSACGAAVYDRVGDDAERRYDLVTLYGTGPFDQVADAASFELLFADDAAAVLDGTAMPGAAQLDRLPVKQLAFGTNAAGNLISRGDFRLRPPG
jgi:hypothetical protein